MIDLLVIVVPPIFLYLDGNVVRRITFVSSLFRRVGAPASSCCKIEVNSRHPGMSLLRTLWSGPGTTQEWTWRQICICYVTLIADMVVSVFLCDLQGTRWS